MFSSAAVSVACAGPRAAPHPRHARASGSRGRRAVVVAAASSSESQAAASGAPNWVFAGTRDSSDNNDPKDEPKEAAPEPEVVDWPACWAQVEGCYDEKHGFHPSSETVNWAAPGWVGMSCTTFDEPLNVLLYRCDGEKCYGWSPKFGPIEVPSADVTTYLTTPPTDVGFYASQLPNRLPTPADSADKLPKSRRSRRQTIVPTPTPADSADKVHNACRSRRQTIVPTPTPADSAD